MSQIALVVEFTVKPEHREAFEELITGHARRTLEAEEGCRQFDVLLPRGEDGRVLLYERYRDDAAFEEHRNSPILAATRAAYADLIDDRKITVCAVA